MPFRKHDDVRITLKIDDDVAALLEKENRRAKEPKKQTVNRILRSGLAHMAKLSKSKLEDPNVK